MTRLASVLASNAGNPRRTLLQLAGIAAAGSLLGGCGFRLRGAMVFAFDRIVINPNPGGTVAKELRRSFGTSVQVLASSPIDNPAPLVLTVSDELRDKTVVGVNSAGQVREYQLRMRVKLTLRNAAGLELMDGQEIALQRDISFTESAVLAKEAEEVLLFRDMQTDIVQQILRRLSAVKPAQLK